MKKENEKNVLTEKFRCPSCKERFVITVKDKITKPAVKAEKVRRVVVERDSQKTLSEV